MAITYGPWQWPHTHFLAMLGATGKLPATTHVEKKNFNVYNYGTLTRIDGGAYTNIGPGMLVVYCVDPASVSVAFNLQCFIDGVEYVQMYPCYPSGSNYVIGGFFEEQMVYRTMPTPTFKRGFSLFADRASGSGSPYQVQALWCTFNLENH